MDWYLPGYRGGGPIRSVANLVAHLSGELEMAVVTSDRDFGEDRPYAAVRPGEWQQGPFGEPVRYLSRGEVRDGTFRRLLAGTPYDVLYLNSLFAPLSRRALALRWAGAVRPASVLVTPRGELSPGALAVKPAKKRLFLVATRAAALYRGVRWHAASGVEAEHIRARFGVGADVCIAPNLSEPSCGDGRPPPPKRPGEARFVFLSRVSRKKNLALGIRWLASLRGEVSLDVFGTREDPAYWEECRRMAAELPEHVRVTFHGPVPPEEVAGTFAAHHFLLMPTLGENYGHAIVEAMRAGCPPIISDQTPWRGLEPAQAGWDLPLDDPHAFVAALQRAVDMGGEEHARWAAGTRRFIERAARIEAAREASLAMFRAAAGGAA